MTTGRDGPSGAAFPSPPINSTEGLNRRAIITPVAATASNIRNHTRSAGAPAHKLRVSWGRAAESAPNDPAAAAMALYQPNPAARASASIRPESIDNSRVVKGPDSITSAERAPVNATNTSTHNGAVLANTSPA